MGRRHPEHVGGIHIDLGGVALTVAHRDEEEIELTKPRPRLA
jgi:hypothetical protein